MSSSLVKYEPLTAEVLDEMNEEFDDLTTGEFAKIPVGKSVWRVLPGLRGARAFVVVMEHFIKLPGGQKSIRFVCPRHHEKRQCLACTRVDTLRASGHAADYEEAGKYMAKLRAYCNVINRGSEARGPQVLALSKQLYNEIKGYLSDGDFTNPADGFDIIIEREGTKMEDTKYHPRGGTLAIASGSFIYYDSRENAAITGNPDRALLASALRISMDAGEIIRAMTGEFPITAGTDSLLRFYPKENEFVLAYRDRNLLKEFRIDGESYCISSYREVNAEGDVPMTAFASRIIEVDNRSIPTLLRIVFPRERRSISIAYDDIVLNGPTSCEFRIPEDARVIRR